MDEVSSLGVPLPSFFESLSRSEEGGDVVGSESLESFRTFSFLSLDRFFSPSERLLEWLGTARLSLRNRLSLTSGLISGICQLLNQIY